jgi:hypothetical protein
MFKHMKYSTDIKMMYCMNAVLLYSILTSNTLLTNCHDASITIMDSLILNYYDVSITITNFINSVLVVLYGMDADTNLILFH